MTRGRRELAVSGTVHGVGLRPHVARLARELRLDGWVENVPDGVLVAIEGEGAAIEAFSRRLAASPPPRARIANVSSRASAARGERGFDIRASATGAGGRAAAPIAADAATCPACLAEVLDPADRRHRHPFTSCNDCGPRYGLLDDVPWDRERTGMRGFAPCARCAAETSDPENRRYHAQANACPDCGPALRLLSARGAPIARRDAALDGAVDVLRAGGIVAVKGLGGYQLLVDARRTGPVRELRRRKRRPHKPFALLLADAHAAARHCAVSEAEAASLASPAAPIVLLRRRRTPPAPTGPGARAGDVPERIARAVAPGAALLGVMLPTTPLHHLICRAVGFPLVATSGNRGGEPIVTADDEALDRLGGIADAFLAHDRSVARALDDSLVRVVAGRELRLRCGRGYAPMTVRVPRGAEGAANAADVDGVLALGGESKATLALGVGDAIVVGEHLGEPGAPRARSTFDAAIADLLRLHGSAPRVVAHDTHPEYRTTRVATRLAGGAGSPIRVGVPHHVAHVAACLADNGSPGPALGVAWDGAGHGGDGTVWGGEFLHVDGASVRRVAHLLPLRLAGGDRASVEPRRAAFGALHALLGGARFAALLDEADEADRVDARGRARPRRGPGVRPELATLRAFAPAERRVLVRLLASGTRAPLASSAGRLLDAVAAVLGLVRRASFEGQAATLLEALADRADGADLAVAPLVSIRCTVLPGTPHVVDWRPALAALLRAAARGHPRAALARDFHAALVGAIVDVARLEGASRVALTGGCFQNARLLEGAIDALRGAGIEPLWHAAVPPNDGGLALGQAVHAARVAAGGRG